MSQIWELGEIIEDELNWCLRYGGWVEGLESNNSVVAAKENSAVYFNNKVFWRLPILWSTILTFTP